MQLTQAYHWGSREEKLLTFLRFFISFTYCLFQLLNPHLACHYFPSLKKMSQMLVSRIIHLELLLILRSTVGDREETAVTTAFATTVCT